MAKPLRIGTLIDVDRPLPDVVTQLRRAPRGRVRPCLRRPDLRARRPHPVRRRRSPGAGHRAGHRRGARLSPAPDDAGPAGADGAGGHRQPPSARHRALPPGRGRGRLGHEFRQAWLLHAGVPGLADADAARGDRQQRGRAGHHQCLHAHRGAGRHRPAGPGRRARSGHAEAGRHRGRRNGHLDDGHGDDRLARGADHPCGGRGGGPARARGSRSPCPSP